MQNVWARVLAYITGTVDQEFLLRNEYLAAENRILRTQLKGRLKLYTGGSTTQYVHRKYLLDKHDRLTRALLYSEEFAADELL